MNPSPNSGRIAWRREYVAGRRECPSCGKNRVVSRLGAKRVYNHTTDRDYVCSWCHID